MSDSQSASPHAWQSRTLRLASIAVMAASVAALTACGGGGGGGGGGTPPPSPPPPAPAPPPPSTPATVTSATAATTTYLAPVIITVTGSDLADGALVLTSGACNGMTRLTAAPHLSTTSTAYYQCNPSAYSGTITVASPAGATLGSASFVIPKPAVTGATVAATRYGDKVLLTVNGSNLDSALIVNSTNCKGLTQLTTAPHVSTPTTAYFQCTASGGYSGTFAVSAADGSSLVTPPTFAVPAPIVTMVVGGAVSGNIVFTLRGDRAPLTVDNFLNYVNSGFYTGLIFHRVVPNFAVQGGGYGAATSGTLPPPKPTTFPPIKLETTGGSNAQWTVAMARTANPDSATSQFFFNLVDNSGTLDKLGYAVFADVTASAGVIQQIAGAPCTPLAGATDGGCVPIPNVTIVSATQTQ